MSQPWRRRRIARRLGHVAAGFCPFLSALRVFASERSENRGVMPTSSHEGPAAEDRHGRGLLSAGISRAVVGLFSQHTGRGPTKARTTIDGELIVVLLHNSMTHAERSLVDAGRHAEVLQMRRTFQETMRESLVTAVEELTDRTVVSFMSANDIDPDAAAEIFVMDRPV